MNEYATNITVQVFDPELNQLNQVEIAPAEFPYTPSIVVTEIDSGSPLADILSVGDVISRYKVDQDPSFTPLTSLDDFTLSIFITELKVIYIYINKAQDCFQCVQIYTINRITTYDLECFSIISYKNGNPR